MIQTETEIQRPISPREYQYYLPRPFYYSTPVSLAGLVAVLVTQADWWSGETLDHDQTYLPVSGVARYRASLDWLTLDIAAVECRMQKTYGRLS